MWVKIHANYRFIKQIQRLADLFVLRIGESILCLLYSITISDRLNCKVVGGLISVQCSEHNEVAILHIIRKL